MRTYKHPGHVLTLTAPAGGVTSGNGYKIGEIFVVAADDAAAAAAFEGQLTGVFALPKETGTAWTEGQRLYWDDTNDRVTTAASGNMPIGVASEAATSGASVGNVRLDGTAGADSVDALASAVDTTAYVHDTSAGTNAAIAAASIDRVVQVTAKVTETLAGTTTSPSFEVGYAGSVAAFLSITSGTAGDVFVGSGTLPSGEALNVTVTDGTGGAEAGEVTISVIAVPTA